MTAREPNLQLRMVYPEHLLSTPPEVRLPPGYSLRTYQQGDERRFFKIMELAGWPGWDDEKLRPWFERTLPEGWFMITHLESGEIAATAMALRDMCEFGVPGGELGWLAGDPAHSGKGLGLSASAAVVARFIQEGYRNNHLYTEDWRLAAIKGYLKLGFTPLLYTPEMEERWQAVCANIQWSFEPEAWGLSSS